ncbi:MAG: hypothetical protein AAGF83_11550 [Cyanobacteria bacterium P01_G01_bin.67]
MQEKYQSISVSPNDWLPTKQIHHQHLHTIAVEIIQAISPINIDQ